MIRPKFLELIGTTQQGEQPIADQIGCCLLTTGHQHNAVGNNFFLAQAISILFRSQQSTNEVFAWMLPVFADSGTKVLARLSQAAQYTRGMVRVMLQVA